MKVNGSEQREVSSEKGGPPTAHRSLLTSKDLASAGQDLVQRFAEIGGGFSDFAADLVVYHPEKRQQGIKDGSLPLLFRDEIEKSWQEYVEQVGAELAKSTPFWAEALNEILAGGAKVF